MSSSYFSVKDYIFIALMAAVMVIIGYLTVPLVIHIPVPGIRSVISAPFMAVFFALALARVEKPGAATLLSFFIAMVYSMISIILAIMIVTGGIAADIVTWLVFRDYRRPAARVLAGCVYFGSHVPVGIILGALFVGGDYSRVFIKPWPMAGMSFVVAILAVLGVCAGNRLVMELRRAGKFPQPEHG
ncbi:MAG: MptD family putative ECF transporter S component [Dissulfuribacterales bacterium]